MTLCIGLDIGGTKFAVAAAGDNGIVQRVEHSTPADFEEGIDLLHSMIGQTAGNASISGIGAAIGGPIDWRRGTVSPLHQPQWRDVPLKEIMEQRWECPLRVEVDTDAAALAEYANHENQPARFLYLTLSTGMGGGFLIDGEIYRGAGGVHPEAAHQAVPLRDSSKDFPPCECGAPDCLEALVCGNGIRRLYGKAPEELGDEKWKEIAWHLGQGLRNLAMLYAPDVIVLGGGISIGAGDKLIQPTTEVMNKHIYIIPAPEVRLARLGSDSALYGALELAKGL